MNEHDAAWDRAIASMPDGWFGPRIEARWPSRWRAWAERADGAHRVSVFGATEVEALTLLASRMELDSAPPVAEARA